MIIPNIWEHKKWQPNHQPVRDRTQAPSVLLITCIAISCTQKCPGWMMMILIFTSFLRQMIKDDLGNLGVHVTPGRCRCSVVQVACYSHIGHAWFPTSKHSSSYSWLDIQYLFQISQPCVNKKNHACGTSLPPSVVWEWTQVSCLLCPIGIINPFCTQIIHKFGESKLPSAQDPVLFLLQCIDPKSALVKSCENVVSRGSYIYIHIYV